MATAWATHPTRIPRSACPRVLLSRRTITALSLSPSPSFSPTLRFQKAPPARKFQVRASRTESKGAFVGFRAPDFEVIHHRDFIRLLEPLTGKVWKLEDFDPYPALLCIFWCIVTMQWSRLVDAIPFSHANCFGVPSFRTLLLKDLFSIIVLNGLVLCVSPARLQKGLAVIAISSNSVTTHPQRSEKHGSCLMPPWTANSEAGGVPWSASLDGPQFMAEEAKLLGYPFPYLYDQRNKANGYCARLLWEQLFFTSLHMQYTLVIEHMRMQSQDVARAFGAVCTPEFFLFKKGLEPCNRQCSQWPKIIRKAKTQRESTVH
ncbi:hypothetical protein ACLOJK_016700 [Asimina triloba]